MKELTNEAVRTAIDDCLSGVMDMPSIRAAVLDQARGEVKVKKKLSVSIVFAVALTLLMMSAAVAAGRRAWGEVAAACAPWEAAAGVACAPWEEEGVACAPRAAEAAALCAAAEVVVPCGLWGAAAEDRVAAAGRQTPEPRGAARVLRRPGSL